MPQDVSKSRKLVSVLSLLAVTCTIVPRGAWAQDSQYVTDYGKKGATAGSTKTTRTKVTTTTAKDATGDTSTKSTVETTTGATTTGTTTGTTTATTKTGTATATTTTKTGTKTLTIVKTIKHVNPSSGAWNQFADYIILKPGQENFPLIMTINNGVDGTMFRAIRGTLSGRSLFTEKDFKGKSTLVLDLSNALTAGSTQVVFQAFGTKGSAFSWDLTSKTTPTITGLNPASSNPGATVKAVGKLLPTDLKSYQITVGGKPATVSAATTQSVDFRVPDGLKPDAKGEVPVLITIAGSKQKPQVLKVVSEPEITGFDHVSISSQQSMTISGKNFGKDASKVKVTFGGIPGTITSVSDTSISLVTPEISDIPSKKEVQIEVNGLKAKKPGVLFFSMRNVENDGSGSPFAVPSQFD